MLIFHLFTMISSYNRFPIPVTAHSIVLLGDNRIDKSNVAKSILGCKNLKEVNYGLSTLYMNEEAERTITVVNSPGWNPISIHQTSKSRKSEIIRSVSLCPPGPHALLLVLPVKKLSEEHSSSEITAALEHVALLSERVWKHTIVLIFV